MRLLILIVIAYLAYRAVRSWIKPFLQGPAQDGSGTPSIDDVMVKDPVCGVYFPRREGVELRHHGNIYIFCSSACRDHFLEDNS